MDKREIKRGVHRALTGKGSIPRSNVPLLFRPHLMQALDHALQTKLTFVWAPAGYGKTITVAEWARKRKEKVCWLSLRPPDNQLRHFRRSLAAVVNRLFPCAEEQIPAADAEADLDPMTLARTVMREIFTVQENFFIVLDDYQVIEHPLVHELVGCLLKIAPESLHMIIISRSALPAALSALHLQGQIRELRTKDLRFQGHEIAALCRKRNVAVTDDSLQLLEKVTEGWPAGLHFALLDLGNAGEGMPVSDATLADNAYIAAYLESEVWGKFPEKVREFMLKTSIFDSFTAAACAAIMPEEHSGSLPALLKQNGAFLSVADGGWFRYHDLYRAFLRKKLANCYNHQLPDLHRRAGEWFEENNFLAEAVNHALQAKDFARAADLIITYAKEALSRGDLHNLSVWFNLLPQAVIDHNPLLGLVCAWTEMLAGRLESCETQLHKLAAFDFAGGDVPAYLVAKIKNELLLIRAAAAANLKCDVDECLALNREAYGRGSIFMNQAIEFNAGEASILARNVKLPLDKVLDFALKMNALWPGIGGPSGSWSVTLGELLYERNDLDNALSVLNEGIGMAERAKIISPFLAGSITLARIARAKGNLDWAFEIVDRAEEKIRRRKADEWLRLLEAFRVWLWVDSGEMRDIAAWLTRYDDRGRAARTRRTEYEEIAKARALQALGRFDESARLLQQCLVRARTENRVPSLVVLLTLQAIARQQTDYSEGALYSLSEALSIARRDGYLRSIVDEGAPVVTLLRQFFAASAARKDSAGPDFINTLLRLTGRHAAGLRTAAGSRPQASADRLTRREQEVLRLLDTGQTNLAIAEQTGVTVNTVKHHIRSLYRKLGVHNRVQAVSRARKLQLL